MDCPAGHLAISIAEIKGQLDALTKASAQSESFSSENRLNVHQEITDVETKLERIEQRLMDKISALQWEVAKLMGKWSIIIIVITSLASIGVSYFVTELHRPENIAALPPKTLSGDVFRATRDEDGLD